MCDEHRCAGVQLPVAQDPRAQTAATTQECLRPGAKRLVHPVAGAAFLAPAKPHALHLEINTDQFVHIDTTGDYIAAQDRRRPVVNTAVAAQLPVDFVGEKGDLSLVRIAVIEEPIAADAMAGDTLKGSHLNRRVLVGYPAVMTEVIVLRRSIEVQNLHGANYHAC